MRMLVKPCKPELIMAQRSPRFARALLNVGEYASFLIAALLCLVLSGPVTAQRIEISRERGIHTLYGDVKVEGPDTKGMNKPLSFELVLYSLSGNIVNRQTVPNNGRYRFMDLHNGHYDIAVIVENTEIARVRAYVNSVYKSDFRQDITMEWRSDTKITKAQAISAGDSYERTPPNQSLFQRAQTAMDNKKYEQAVSLLGQLVAADSKDFQAWTELGTAHLSQNNSAEAEKAYTRALEERPTFFLPLLNLGRLLIAQKKFEAAIQPLTRAVELQPTSPEANLLLGEVYLQVKKGSKAVGYLNEALRLDPVGTADAHLRLAALYNAVGMKDKAADEYEAFLKKKPGHPDKKKLEQYIAQNKKR